MSWLRKDDAWALLELKRPCAIRDTSFYLNGVRDVRCKMRRSLGCNDRVRLKDCLGCKLKADLVPKEAYDEYAAFIKHVRERNEKTARKGKQKATR